MSDKPRPVWLTKDTLARLLAISDYLGGNVTCLEIIAAWDAAPADAAVNVRDALILTVGIGGMERCIGPVLRSLGMPA